LYTINRELESFSKELAQRPQIVAANKIDLPSAQENIDRLEDEIKESGLRSSLYQLLLIKALINYFPSLSRYSMNATNRALEGRMGLDGRGYGRETF